MLLAACKILASLSCEKTYPEPESLTKAVLEKVGEEIDEITKEKFAEPTDKDYKTARNLMGSQGSDGSLASKVREEAGSGAPPSADNNV